MNLVRLGFDWRRGLGLVAFAFLIHPSALAQSDWKDVYEAVHRSTVSVTAGDSVGTGFVVFDRRHVATALHVIEKELVKDSNARVSVRLANQREVAATAVAVDSRRDVAILRFSDDLSYPAIRLQDALPSPGEAVAVIGSPLGLLDQSISDGIVGSIRADLDGLSIQFTAPVSPGSSGSPLLSKKGSVLGLVISRVRGADEVNLAIPALTIRGVLSRDFVSLENGSFLPPATATTHSKKWTSEPFVPQGIILDALTFLRSVRPFAKPGDVATASRKYATLGLLEGTRQFVEGDAVGYYWWFRGGLEGLLVFTTPDLRAYIKKGGSFYDLPKETLAKRFRPSKDDVIDLINIPILKNGATIDRVGRAKFDQSEKKVVAYLRSKLGKPDRVLAGDEEESGLILWRLRSKATIVFYDGTLWWCAPYSSPENKNWH
ncbi:MAG: trypsin-like peptidase domain-containing protein [Armatimonadetes bacterium]|nr:trypsin-like peptidase domain-containing protein [Armatimonadota bacterium]